MSSSLTCPQGHRWKVTPGTNPPAVALCPVCGAAAAPAVERGNTLTSASDLLDAGQPRRADDSGTMAPSRPAPPVAAAAFPGTIPGYEVLGEVGRGGMGVVYKARQVGLNRMVALKMILAGGHAGPRERARFRVEAEAVARLQHPNIVQVYEVGEHEGRPYLSLEFIAGGTLAHRLAGVPLPPRQAAEMVEPLARAIHYAHERGVVHRDLKPGNILLAADARRATQIRKEKTGEETNPSPIVKDLSGSAICVDLRVSAAKITDFGLARQLDTEGPTQTDAVMGTASYMAPEQLTGKSRDVGPPADVYALGAILYECLTGQPPFRGENKLATLELVRTQEPVPPSRLQPRVPRDLETICLKCLHKEPPRRYASAANLADDLGRFLGGAPIQARPVGMGERTWKWARRRPAVAGLLAALLFVLALGLAGMTWGYLEAVAARQGEAEHRRLAEAALEKAETHGYFRAVAQARLERQANNPVRAELVLDQCPMERRGWEWHYLKNLLHAELFTTPPRHSSEHVNSVAFSPDGTRLASAGGGNPFFQTQGPGSIESGEVILWDARTGEEVRQLHGHTNVVVAVAFSPDGRRLASTGLDGTVRLWDSSTGEALQVLPGHSGRAVAFSPDGHHLAAPAPNGTVQLWDASAGRVVHTLRGHTAPVQGVAFSPDGDRLVAAAEDGSVRLWYAGTGQLLRTVTAGPGSVEAVAFSPDGQQLAGAGADGTARVWDAATGMPRHTLTGHQGSVFGVAFSPDGRTLATGGADRTVRVWELRSGQEWATLRGHARPVRGVAFDPTGRRLASTGLDGTVKVWDLTLHPEHAAYREPIPGPNLDWEAVAFDADSQFLVCVRKGGLLQRRDARSGRVCDERHLDVRNAWWTPGSFAAFSGDGRRLVAVSRQEAGLLHIWDVTTGALLHTLPGHQDSVVHLAFSHDGRRVASASLKGQGDGAACEVRIWDAIGGKLLTTFTPTQPVRGGLALSPEGERLAFDGFEVDRPERRERHLDLVRLWDVTHEGEVRTLRGHQERVSALAFSPDGRRLASADLDAVVRLWDVASGQTLQALEGPEICMGLAFSPDGQRLAAAGRNRVKLWDTGTGEELLTLRGAPPRPSDNGFNPRVAFSPDGRRLAAINWNDSLSIWSADDADTTPAARQQAAAGRALAWHLSQARASLDAGQAFAADFHLRQVPDLELPPLLARQRGDLHARQGHWRLAVRDYRRAFGAAPSDDPQLWYQHALLCLKVEDAESFHKVAAAMRERFGHNSDPDTQALLARTCLLLPQRVDDGRVGLAWAEIEPKRAWRLHTAALAQYRAGQYQQAIRCCVAAQETDAKWSPALAAVLLGLAHQRLGDAAEARQWFRKAEEGAPELEWWQRVEYDFLRREVETRE